MSEENNKNKINENIKELVVARIEAQLPSNLKLSLGSWGSLTKEEMIKHVKSGDEQGEQIINMHLNFIKAVISGRLVREVNSI